MRRHFVIPLILALVGSIFVTAGAGTYFSKATTTMVCEACGMEVRIGDSSTHAIVTDESVTRYGCCPICALAIAIYYKKATVSVPCFACGREITAVIKDGSLLSISPSGAAYNVSVIYGAACMRNKIVCCQTCAGTVKNSYEWAQNLPVMTIGETFSKAGMKAQQTTIAPQQIKIPMITTILILAGIVLFVLAPVTSRIVKIRLP